MSRQQQSPVITLHVERAVPSLALRPGDLVMVEAGSRLPVAVIRYLEANKAIVASLELALDRGHITTTLPYAAYAALSALAGRSPLPLVSDFNAALARLESDSPLPHEGTANERKRGDK